MGYGGWGIGEAGGASVEGGRGGIGGGEWIILW